MKKFVTGIILIVCFCVFVLPQADAQVLWRSAKCMKKGQVIVMGEWYYKNLTKIWQDDEWQDYDHTKVQWGFETMFGYAPLDRWEVMLHVPFMFKSYSNGEDESASGIGDIFFKTRYGILPWAKDKHGLALVGSLRLPTGADDEDFSWNNTGDGTTDFALGAIYSTPFWNDFRGHLKTNYWINGKNDDDVKGGNILRIIVKLDRNISKKVMGFATYIMDDWGDGEDADGNSIKNEKIRHFFVLGGVWKPKPGLFIRPKVSFSLGGKIGTNASYVPKLDVWYVFKLL